MKLCSSQKGGKAKEGTCFFLSPINHSGYIWAKTGESEVRGGEKVRGQPNVQLSITCVLVYGAEHVHFVVERRPCDITQPWQHLVMQDISAGKPNTKTQCWWWELLHTLIPQKHQAVPSQLMAHTISCNVCNKMWKCHKHVVFVCLFFSSHRECWTSEYW